jgi:hypothetical protein
MSEPLDYPSYNHITSRTAETVTFVGVLQMERYLLGVDPSFDDERVEEALRFAIRAIAIADREIAADEVDGILARVRFLSRDEYRAEVGEEAWESETGFVPGWIAS